MAILQFLHVRYKSDFISKIIIFKYIWIFHGEWEWKILLGRVYKVTHGMCTLTYGPNKSGNEWRHNLWTVSDIYYICFSRISMLKTQQVCDDWLCGNCKKRQQHSWSLRFDWVAPKSCGTSCFYCWVTGPVIFFEMISDY